MALTQITTGGVDENINIDSNTLKVDGANNRVGIGTASPQRPLHVNGTEGVLRLTSTASGNNGFEVGVGTASQAFLWNAENSHTEIATNNTERLRIDSSGNLGLGTSSPQAALDIFTSTGPYFRGGSDNTARQLVIESSTTTNAGDTHTFRASSTTGAIAFANSVSSERMRIDSSGNLTAYSGSTNGNYFVIRGKHSPGNEYNRSEVRFGVENNANGLGFLAFATGNNTASERLRIDSSGNVGIGTSSPSTKLHLNSTAGIATRIESTGTSGDTILNLKGNVNNWELTAPNSSSVYGFYIKDVANSRIPLFIDGSGNVGIGTSNPDKLLHVNSSGNTRTIVSTTSASAFGQMYFGDEDKYVIGYRESHANQARQLSFKNTHSSGTITFRAGGDQERMRIDSSGNVGVGLTSPASKLHVKGGSLTVEHGSPSTGTGQLNINSESNSQVTFSYDDQGHISFGTATTPATQAGFSEKMRIASSGNVGIGTDSPGQLLTIKKTGYQTQVSLISDTNESGAIYFGDTASTNRGVVLYDHGQDSLQLYTAASERMRIDSSGDVLIGTTSAFSGSSSTATGHRFESIGVVSHFRNSGTALYVGRQGNDGDLVSFRQAGSQEGSISVSGSTVSFNGGHLSRWSQLPGGAERTEILRGSVLSNLNEMCEWGEEDNEQLNRMKVSDVEGDKNVSGVFQAWDDDDDTYVNDFYCAMTGDFVIRIAQGTTVARGDLLMSAGDGTAKPQDDDIVRSKTIAKVTSTTVSTTYSDNSYCVPCVLMAC
jgi:hypothetical protein